MRIVKIKEDFIVWHDNETAERSSKAMEANNVGVNLPSVVTPAVVVTVGNNIQVQAGDSVPRRVT